MHKYIIHAKYAQNAQYAKYAKYAQIYHICKNMQNHTWRRVLMAHCSWRTARGAQICINIPYIQNMQNHTGRPCAPATFLGTLHVYFFV